MPVIEMCRDANGWTASMTQVEGTHHLFYPGFDSDVSRRGLVGRGTSCSWAAPAGERTNNIPENVETKLENLTFDSDGKCRAALFRILGLDVAVENRLCHSSSRQGGI